MYIDETKKQAYYKQNIMQRIASTGVYPSLALVNQQLDDLDLKLSVFTNTFKPTGGTFDVDLYNQELEQIYADLTILYECVNELAVVEYTELKNFIDRELLELQNLAEEYNQRTTLELTNMFGTTLFYQGSGFDQQYLNGEITVSLGDITTHESAKVACFVGGTDLPVENISFTLGDYKLSPYSLNSDTIRIPGEINRETYIFIMNEDQQSMASSTIPVQIDNFTPSVYRDYRVLAGKNYVSFTRNQNYEGDPNMAEYMDMTQAQSLYFEYDGTLEFVIYGGSYLTVDTSQELISSSVDTPKATNLDRIQNVKLGVAAETALELYTDGTIYIKEVNNYINDGVFYISTSLNTIYDYLIEESYEADEYVLSDCKMVISNADQPYYDITTIAVKESQVYS